MTSQWQLCCLLVLTVPCIASAAHQATHEQWKQPLFAIGGYFAEFLGAGADYTLLAENNFTVALIGSNASQCAALGLGCIVPAIPMAPTPP